MLSYPVLRAAAFYCASSGIQIPAGLERDLSSIGIKTEGYYLRVLSQAVRDLYNDKITTDDFLSTESRLLDEQIVRAWNEGMRLNDLNPQTDMKPEWEQMIKDIQNSEFDYVQGFMDAIEQARRDGTPIQPLLDRAELWASRYSDVVSRSQVITAPKDLNFFWKYGPTNEHCQDCSDMVAVGVQTAEFWRKKQAEGIYPGSPQLACHGFHCECGLESTDEKVTAG
jgi:hypothetical protein